MTSHTQDSPVTMNGLISLPLSKFSWTTDSASETQLSWKHTTQDVFLVFDTLRSGSSSSQSSQMSKIMKVVQGSNILEEVNITEKVESAITAITQARKFGIQLRSDQYPTAALHRRAVSVIAVRYPLANDNQVHRMQLKFTSDQDFQVAFDFLEGIGCPMTQSPPPPRSENAGPSCPPSSLATLASQSYPPPLAHILDNSRNIVSDPSQVLQQQDLSQCTDVMESRLLPRASRRVQPDSSGQTENATPHDSNTASQSHLHRSFTSPFFASTQALRQHITSMTTIGEHTPSFVCGPTQYQRYAPAATATGIRNQIDESRHMGAMLPPRLRAFSTMEAQSIPAPDPVLQTGHSEVRGIGQFDASSAQRPFTSPTSRVEDSFNQLMPPRRELPFRRTSTLRKSHSGDEHKSSSRPSAATLNHLPPLPQPKFVGKEASHAHERSLEQGSTVQDVERRSTIRSDVGKTCATHDASRRPPTAPEGSSPRSYVTANSNVSSGRSKRPLSAISEDAENARQSAPPDHKKRLGMATDRTLTSAITSEATHHSHNTENASDQSGSHLLKRISDELFVSGSQSLAAFARLRPEGQDAIINDLILHCIADENFVPFAEAVDSNWRRIGLSV